MKPSRLIPLITVCAAACAPDPQPSATALDARAAAAWTAQIRQPLSESVEPLGDITGYVTQTIEGVDAPIAYMQAKCPERILDARETPEYGLEAPYRIKRMLLRRDDLLKLPIADYTTAAETPYDGQYVLVQSGDVLMSVFPAGVATTLDADGKTVPAAKLLRTFNLFAGRSRLGVTDKNGRDWDGVRLSARVRFPHAPNPALTEVLEKWEADPCQ